MFETHYDEGYFNLMISQTNYIEKSSDLLSQIAGTDISYTPTSVTVQVRFVTYCPFSTDWQQNEIEDEFTLEIIGSGETETSLCSIYYEDLVAEG
jgi:hypothetical protein